jgi:hypothetical protein
VQDGTMRQWRWLGKLHKLKLNWYQKVRSEAEHLGGIV